MSPKLNDQATRMMELAAGEARQLNHAYVGTEHILLALIVDGSTPLATLGLDPQTLRNEIARLVQPGPTAPPAGNLPLTPRARRVLESASTEAASLTQSEVAPEHLLVGLMHEPDGVAAMVMQNLGLTFDRVRAESFKTRLHLMSVVERVVRPVRTGIAAKRKMREELLAHISAIYREELDRLHDPCAAMTHAAERFGDPGELSRELQNAVTWDDRLAERAEWWFAWRPTESVTKMMLRTSLLSALIIGGLIGMCVAAAGIIVDGWNAGERFTVRILAAMVLITPAAQFAIGMIYYKMRDASFGVFGSRRSWLTVLVCCVLMALTLCGAMVAFISITNASLVAAMEFVPRMALFAPLAAITLLAVVRMRGPVEILDTTWACLDLNAS